MQKFMNRLIKNDSRVVPIEKALRDFDDDYKKTLEALNRIKEHKIRKLKQKLASKIQFKKGDIVYSSAGIVLVEKIEVMADYNGRGERIPVHARLHGTRLYWLKGGYVTPVKRRTKGWISVGSHLKKIESNKLIIKN